jgi:hypothetical protein
MSTRPTLRFLGVAALLLPALLCAQAPEPIVPQTALSRCPPVRVAAREDIAPGTAIAVSPDGRRMALYFHTIHGAELTLRDRETAETHRVELAPPTLPPGVVWQIREAVFSRDGELLFVESVGKVWAIAAATGETLYEIGVDDQQRFPGQVTLGGERLALIFWPAESFLAAAKPKGQTNVRLYDARSGRETHNLFLPIRTPDAWTRIALSPDGERLAVLMRPTRWPGTARLAMYSVGGGAALWEKKVSAEDLAWSADIRELLILGGELQWLDAASGKKLRAAEKKTRYSEYQKLRTSDAANLAAGFFQRYNPLRRTFDLSESGEPQFRIWRLDSGKATCDIALDPTVRVDVWPTSRGELVALEESYDVRPPLRILRAARIVTYSVEQPSAAPRTPPSSSACGSPPAGASLRRSEPSRRAATTGGR